MERQWADNPKAGKTDSELMTTLLVEVQGLWEKMHRMEELEKGMKKLQQELRRERMERQGKKEQMKELFEE